MWEVDIERLMSMNAAYYWSQPWIKWRLGDFVDQIGPKEGPNPWPWIVGDLIKAASLKVAANIGGDDALAKHADALVQFVFDDDPDLCPPPRKWPFPPKRGTRIEQVLSALVLTQQSLPEGALRNEMEGIIKSMFTRE